MSDNQRKELRPFMSRSQALALSLGTSVGWGALVVTANTYLAQAGPKGSVLGLIIGGLVMLLISRNYHYLMNAYPESGGSYAYVRSVFGYDRGFMAGWFLALTYFAVLWANITSLPLFARFFIGDIFEFAKLYTIFGYDVYLGEALLSIGALLLVGWLCIRREKLLMRIMVVLVAVFFFGIVACCVAALCLKGSPIAPAYVPDGKALGQIVTIAVITPWAFIGFENISHVTPEFAFPRRKAFRILTLSVIMTTALYIAVTLLSVTAYPARYGSWLEYIRNLGNLGGLEALPAFYAANHYLGQWGVGILMAALLALVLTSLIGNITALSRLLYAVAKDDILPEKYADVNAHGAPHRAIGLIMAVSCFIPFVGRTAIGWIVDVTTMGATMVYGFISAAVIKQAARCKDRHETFTGWAGLSLMVLFGGYLLLPTLFQESSMATETYLLFVVWSMLGLFFFHRVVRKDRHNRYGSAIVVWIVFLAFLLFIALVWMSQYNMRATDDGMHNLQDYYSSLGYRINGESYISSMIESLRRTQGITIAVVVSMFIVSLGMLVSNYTTLSHRARHSEEQLGQMRAIANTDPLTGVKSKRAFTEAEEQLDREIADGRCREFSVLVCDLNGLKHINDTQGHKAGDQYILEASNLICDHFKHSPVFRIGGDEFAVLLTGQDFAAREEIIAAFNRQVEENLKTGRAVISLGAASFRPGEDAFVYNVFQRADDRMYERKQQLKSMGSITRD
ncbi:MAG: amino acid permease [Clostridia bacterium]|nr:amino acid permease [Clostridia bacterium]